MFKHLQPNTLQHKTSTTGVSYVIVDDSINV